MPPDAHREYMILQEVLPGERGKSLLGSVIYHSHHTRPDDDHVPDRSNLNQSERIQVEKLFEEVWNTPAGHVGLEDLTRDRSHTWSGQASTNIFKLFDGWIRRTKGQSYTITAGKTKRYTIPNVGQQLKKKYIECEPWWKEVKDHYERADHHKQVVLYLITGVWLCSDMVVQSSDSSSAGAGTAVDLAAGQPNAPSAKAKVEMNTENSNKRTEKIRDEVVFAIKCHRLHPIDKLVSPGSSGMWPFSQSLPARKTLVGLRLGLPVPGSASAYAGSDSEDDPGETNTELHYFYIAKPAFASIVDIDNDDNDNDDDDDDDDAAAAATVARFNGEAQ